MTEVCRTLGLAGLLLCRVPALGASNGDYQSHQSGDWNSPTTWETWHGNRWETPVSTIPSSNDGVITIRSGHTVTATSSVTADQLVAESGAQLSVGSGGVLTLANGSGTDADVYGMLQNAGTIALATGATLLMEPGGTYQHLRDGGAIPVTSWSSGSTCEIIGVTSTAPAGLNQSFYDFIWNCPGQTTDVTLNGNPTTLNGSFTIVDTGTARLLGISGGGSWPLSIGGDFNLSGGNFDFSEGTGGTLVLNLAGSYTQTGGTFDCSNGASALSFNINGSNQRFLQSGGVFATTGINFSVAGNASLALDSDLNVSASRTCTVNGTLDCGHRKVVGAGSFTLAPGATLLVGDAAGISAAAASGNIQVTGPRSFSDAANYVYNGTAPQTAGDGLPPTVNSLTVSNSAGVELGATTVVNGALNLNNGVLRLGSNRLNLAVSAVVSGGNGGSYVNGTFQKAFAAGTGQTFTFPIGDEISYLPVAISSMNLGAGSGGNLAVSTTAGDHSGLSAAGLDAAQSVNRYWTLAGSAGLAPTSFSATFAFAPGEVDAGASSGTFVVRRYSGGSWAASTTGTRTATSIQATGLTGFGDFVAAENVTDHYAVTAVSPQTAGVPFNTTVTAQDIFNQPVTADSSSALTFSGSGFVQFDANGDSVFGDNLKTLSNGTVTISTRDTVAEVVAVTVSDGSLRTGILNNLLITAGPASKLILLTQPSSAATAGQPFATQPIVAIADAFNNLRSSDTSVVTATRSSGAGTLLGSTNVPAVNGVVTYADLAHPMATNITLRFTSGSLAAAASGVVSVAPAAFSRLLALLPGETVAPATPAGRTGSPSAIAGLNTLVRVLAIDNWFNPTDSPADLVHLTTSDPYAVLPNDFSLGSGNSAANVVFKTGGTQSVTATDLTDGAKLSNIDTVTVQAGTLAKLQILVPGESAVPGSPAGKTGTPRSQVPNVAFDLTVNGVDANWNTANTNDTVGLTSSDSGASLPGAAALSGGSKTFSVTLATLGSSTITASDISHAQITPSTSVPITVSQGAEPVWGMPFVAIQDSEFTRALEAMPAAPSTPSGPGTTGFEWWPTNWHYFVMPEAMKELCRSDGTLFRVVSDADIRAGALLDANGRPKYPILISLAAEAMADDEVSRLTNYVGAGGFILCGSSSFTRYTNGVTRQDFALADAMGIHMVQHGLSNWGLDNTVVKLNDSRLTSHLPSGTLTWRMPSAAEEIPWGTSPTHNFLAPHLIWQVQPADATVLLQGDTLPYLLTKPFGKGRFIYHAAMQPLLGFNGFAPNMHSYMVFRKAIEWAFESAKLPLPRISPWPYQYDAAFVLRRDLENFTNAIASIAASAQIDYTNGAKGDYYFCTGTLREDAASAYDTNAIIAGLRTAVSSYGATIGPHNGGLKNPNNPALKRGEYDYWHWGPDEALDVTPSNYPSGKVYALTSISNSFRDVEGWLTGLTNGLRAWVACYFNSTREDSYDIQAQLGVRMAGEQRLGPFPHWTLSTRTSGKHYPFLSEPTSDWFVNGLVAQSLEPWRPPAVQTSQTLHAGVDFYYKLGGLLNFYSHTLSTGLGDAGQLPLDYITYSLNTNLHPRLWSANAVGVYRWWQQRSNVQMTANCVADLNQSITTLSISGATNPDAAVEVLIPDTGTALGLQVFTNGVVAGPGSYRTNGNLIRVRVGTTITGVEIHYLPVPRAQDDAYSLVTDTTLAASAPGVLANDTPGMGTNLTAALVLSPANGSLALNADGSFSYTPASGFSGTDFFTYQANDGVTNSVPAIVTLTVLPPGALFLDTFTRPTNSGTVAPWLVQSGTWTATNGTLRGGLNAPYTYGISYLTNRWTNYSVQARVRFPAGAYGGGVAGRLNPTTGARYAAWVYPEGSSGGSSVLKLIKFQTWTSYGYGSLVPSVMQEVSLPAVGTNWHTVKLSLVGNQISAYYDDNRVLTATDLETQPYFTGGISLEMWTDAASYPWEADDVMVLAAPTPVIQSLEVSGSLARITWSALAGQRYRLQHKDNLDDSAWQDDLPEITAVAETAAADVALGIGNRRFYRVLLVP